MNFREINSDYLFFGYDGSIAYYISFEEKSLRGWSFMGLEPQTEEVLREHARDIDPEDYMDIPDHMEKYFDYDAFADDMEDDWLENHDSRGEIEDEETYYMGFVSGQDIYGFRKYECKNYDEYVEYMDECGLNQEQFEELYAMLDNHIDTNLYSTGTEKYIEQRAILDKEKEEVRDWAVKNGLLK